MRLGRAQRRAVRDTLEFRRRRPPAGLRRPAGQTLQEQLLWQLELASLAPRQLAIARAIIDAISDDGYLTDSLEEIAGPCSPRSSAPRPKSRRCSRRCRRSIQPASARARWASASSCSCASWTRRRRDSRPRSRSRAIIWNWSPSASCRCCAASCAPPRRRSRQALALVRSCHPRPGVHRQPGQGGIRHSGRVRAPHRPRLDRRDQSGDAAARAPQPELRESHRPQREPRQHAHAAAGGALAAEEPRDPQRDADEGGALASSSARPPSSSTARSTCGR